MNSRWTIDLMNATNIARDTVVRHPSIPSILQSGGWCDSRLAVRHATLEKSVLSTRTGLEGSSKHTTYAHLVVSSRLRFKNSLLLSNDDGRLFDGSSPFSNDCARSSESKDDELNDWRVREAIFVSEAPGCPPDCEVGPHSIILRGVSVIVTRACSLALSLTPERGGLNNGHRVATNGRHDTTFVAKIAKKNRKNALLAPPQRNRRANRKFGSRN